MEALLEATDLRAFYGPTSVLRGLSFSIQAGGITTILGANGAGKTTTLRAVCGMIRTEGEVRFAGTRIDGSATEDIVRLGIAHVPDGRGTFVNLTVEDGGPGLPDHLKEAVFERFTTGSDEARGTGIGLWVVARLAEVNGGRAWVEERVGGGASFRVVLSTTEPAEAKADPDADIWLDYEDSSRS